jgi:hypothetical protein
MATAMTYRTAVSWGLLLGGVVSQVGCSSTNCEWEPEACPTHESICAAIQGCSVGPASCQNEGWEKSGCGQHGTKASCSGPPGDPCSWTDAGACVSACTTVTDQQSCNSLQFTGPDLPTSPLTGEPVYVNPCTWSTCSGTPLEEPCGDYSINACPMSLQCYVVQSGPYLSP